MIYCALANTYSKRVNEVFVETRQMSVRLLFYTGSRFHAWREWVKVA